MKRWTGPLVAVLALVLLTAAGLAWYRQGLPEPTATLTGADRPIGHAPTKLVLDVKAATGHLKGLDVMLTQAGKDRVLLHEDLAGQKLTETHREIPLDAAALKLEEGPAEVRVLVDDDAWRPKPAPTTQSVGSLAVDLTAPSLEFRAATKYIKHSGTGVAVWRAKGASKTSVRVGAEDFPGIKGLSGDADVVVALFTIPYSQPEALPSLHAEDEAGNERTLVLPVVFLPSDFGRDEVKLNDAFMQRKVAELAPQSTATEGDALLQAFLKINREMRHANEAHIREIGASASEPRALFAGAFRQQPSSKVFAAFPQERDYTMNGKTVDTEWHLGLDLASNSGVPVLAANAGKVIYAADNGIYGNMVVVDHGLSLCTLYAHLSEIGVQPGQSVTQGEALGRSGQTGLAAGDHIHYATMVHGVYTNPPDWFDAKYIGDRIAGPLREAGIDMPGVTDRAGSSGAAPASSPEATDVGEASQRHPKSRRDPRPSVRSVRRHR